MSKFISSISVTGGTINGSNLPLVATGTISSGQLLDMTTPITLIAAPGAGNIIVLDQITWSYTYVSTTYASGASFRFYYNNNVAEPTAKAWLEGASGVSATSISTAVSTFGIYGNNAVTQLNPSFVVNMPITISTASAFTTGDGNVKYNISYRVVSV